MSLRRIRVFPDPILRKKCRVVRRVDEKVRELANDMIETMDAAGGVGLAANQVGALQRVVTLHLPEEESGIILVNPECILDKHREEERASLHNGCTVPPVIHIAVAAISSAEKFP